MNLSLKLYTLKNNISKLLQKTKHFMKYTKVLVKLFVDFEHDTLKLYVNTCIKKKSKGDITPSFPREHVTGMRLKRGVLFEPPPKSK